ncbi:hypothetical protein C8F01DRAFT_1371391 [Mycena amicta]|nr:hypothetical protein C8F01DRAFT_1371391 [Mycena amicta]
MSSLTAMCSDWESLNVTAHHHERQRSSQRPASALLPIELWELVLDEASDESLIVLARVLSTFPNRPSSIRSHLIRSLFVLVCEPPHITSLKCTFWSFGAGRGILMLRELVKNWPSLTQIHLIWPRNVLSMRSEMEDNYTKKIPATLYLAALWELISVVANEEWWAPRLGRRRVAASVRRRRFSVRDTGLHGGGTLIHTHSEPRPGILVRATQYLASSFEDHPPSGQAIWSRIFNHTLSFTSNPMQLSNATLLEFDMRSLTLQPNESFSAADISALLPRITLPSLTILELGSSDIDPSALSAFIEHHPQIQTFKLACSWGFRGPLCTDIAVLLDTFDTEAMAPYLSYVSMTLRRTTPDERAALSRALVRLSLRRHTATTYLELVLPPDFASTPPPEDNEIAALCCLTHVPVVSIVIAGSLGDTYAALPWLAHLPALVRLEWSVDSIHEFPAQDKNVAAQFEAAARKAMPGVQYVWAKGPSTYL